MRPERLLTRSTRSKQAPLPLVAAAALALAIIGLRLPAIPLGAQQAASTQGLKPSPAAAPAQDSTSSDGKAGSSTRQTIRVTVGVVNVAVSVVDKRGIPVIGLSKSDFEVYEDGNRQAITYFGKEPPLPLRIGLVLDTSNSARTQLPFEKDAASAFVFAMLQGRSSRNQIFLQTFDATSSIVQDFVNDPEVLNEKVRELKAGGGKALYDAIYFACREKMLSAGSPENTRRVLVLMSDGRDIQSTHTLDEALSMAHKAGTVIYAIGNAAYGYANPTDKVLEEIAQETGGAALFPLRVTAGADLGTGYLSHGQIGDTSQNKGLGAETGVYSAQRLIQLADSLDSISQELNEQYTIGYTPTNNVLDGTFRSIQVVALRKGVHVRSKPGYFATRE